MRLAAGTSADLHRRLLGEGAGSARSALSRPSHRTRRTIHLSRAQAARRLCDARSYATPSATCAPSSARLKSWIIATLADFGVTGERRAGRVGVWVERPEKARGRGRRNGGRQDRRHRRAPAAMGELPRRRAQCRAGSDAFFRHRALRRARRASWRHKPRRSRRGGGHACRRRRAAQEFRGDLRPGRGLLKTRWERTPRAPQARRTAHRLH